MKNRFFYSYFSLQTNSGVISPKFKEVRAVLLSMGFRSLNPASRKTANIWPGGRCSISEPGLCSCCVQGKSEGPGWNSGVSQGTANMAPSSLRLPSLFRLSLPTLPEVTSEEAIRARNFPSLQGILTKWIQNSRQSHEPLLERVTLEILVRERGRHCLHQARS